MFTLRDMERFATEAWGPLGAKTVERWVEFNQLYFGGRLRPVPVVITHAQPYGRRMAFCSYAGADRAGWTSLPRRGLRSLAGKAVVSWRLCPSRAPPSRVA